MLALDKPSDFLDRVGTQLGTSEWLVVDQAMINAFAEATGDHQWIHVDTERAAREMPDGKTIAHGYLLLSLLPRLAPQIWGVTNRSRSVNYGANRVRFTAPVQVGSRIRLRQEVASVDAIEGGIRLIMNSTMEIEGSDRPACVAETISLIYD